MELEEDGRSVKNALKLPHRLYKICRDLSTHLDENHLRNLLLSVSLLNPSEEWKKKISVSLPTLEHLSSFENVYLKIGFPIPRSNLRSDFENIYRKVRRCCEGVDQVYAHCVSQIKGFDRYAEFSRAAAEWQFAPLLVALW